MHWHPRHGRVTGAASPVGAAVSTAGRAIQVHDLERCRSAPASVISPCPSRPNARLERYICEKTSCAKRFCTYRGVPRRMKFLYASERCFALLAFGRRCAWTHSRLFSQAQCQPCRQRTRGQADGLNGSQSVQFTSEDGRVTCSKPGGSRQPTAVLPPL